MATVSKSQSFFDGQVARILAMILAVLIGLFLFTNWSEDIKNLFASGSATTMIVEGQPAKELNPGLTACLAKRVGDVDQMKAEGILSNAQYVAFTTRAEDLCRVQNPG